MKDNIDMSSEEKKATISLGDHNSRVYIKEVNLEHSITFHFDSV